jgi:DNA processing protein
VTGRLEARGVRAIGIEAPGYPEGLRDLPDPPPALFVRGELPARPRAVAIVGSRAATAYGLAVAHALAADLARLGAVVVSGLARGIDAAAHRGALDAEGASVAVLPGGLDAVTPPGHAALADALLAHGGLVTEWPSGPPPRPALFVRRNRLIAALASAVVVVEAAESSGALSTAAVARRLGRALFAVPGDVDRPTSRGCHALLRAGAAVCESAADVLRVIDAGSLARGRTGTAPRDRLRAALAAEPRALEALALDARVPVGEALSLLLELEWAGVARPAPGQRWSRA